MKQQKMDGYAPNYPKKVIKGAALAATALIALGAAAGCRYIRPDTTGVVPIEDVQTEGMVPIEEMLTPEPPMTPGEPMVEPTPSPEELMLSGDVQIIDENMP